MKILIPLVCILIVGVFGFSVGRYLAPVPPPFTSVAAITPAPEADCDKWQDELATVHLQLWTEKAFNVTQLNAVADRLEILAGKLERERQRRPAPCRRCSPKNASSISHEEKNAPCAQRR